MLLRPHFANRDDVLIARGGYLCSSCTNAPGSNFRRRPGRIATCQSTSRPRFSCTNASESVAPDCVVAFGVDPAAREARNGYIIAEAGSQPQGPISRGTL